MTNKKTKVTTIIKLPIAGTQAVLAPARKNTARIATPLYVKILVQLMIDEGWIETSIIRHRLPFSLLECSEATQEQQALRDSIIELDDKDFKTTFVVNKTTKQLTKELFLAEFDLQHKVKNGIVPAYTMTNCVFVVEGNQRRNAIIAANALLREQGKAINTLQSIELDFITQAREGLSPEATDEQVADEAVRLSKLANILENRHKSEGTLSITALDNYKACLTLFNGSMQGFQAVCREAIGASAGQKVAAIKQLGQTHNVDIVDKYGMPLDDEILRKGSKVPYTGLAGVDAVALCNGKKRVGKVETVIPNAWADVELFLSGGVIADKAYQSKTILGLCQGATSPLFQTIARLLVAETPANTRRLHALMNLPELATKDWQAICKAIEGEEQAIKEEQD